MGSCKRGVPFLSLHIQPFLLISWAWSQELPLCRPLLSCWRAAEGPGPTLGSLHCQEMSPTKPKMLSHLFLLMQAGAPKSVGLPAEGRHQDLALRTDICKSVFLFLLPLCFSNKDKATRKKGTWNSVKNTQKCSTNSQITNKTNKKKKSRNTKTEGVETVTSWVCETGN